MSPSLIAGVAGIVTVATPSATAISVALNLVIFGSQLHIGVLQKKMGSRNSPVYVNFHTKGISHHLGKSAEIRGNFP